MRLTVLMSLYSDRKGTSWEAQATRRNCELVSIRIYNWLLVTWFQLSSWYI